MKQQLRKGQSPTKPNVIDKDDYSLLFNESTILDVPANCKEELEKKKLECRWIDLNLFKKNGGMHKKGWQPYKFDCLKGGVSNSTIFGGNDGQQEGYLVRNMLVLAAKTVESAEIERKKVKLRTKLQADPAQMKVQEMKEYIRGSGVKMSVTGPEDDDE